MGEMRNPGFMAVRVTLCSTNYSVLAVTATPVFPRGVGYQLHNVPLYKITIVRRLLHDAPCVVYVFDHLSSLSGV